MKFLLVILLAFVACSKKTDITRESSTADTTAPTPELVSPWKDCEGLRDDIVTLIRSRVPELDAIGAPYIKRMTEGKGELTFTKLRCPQAGATDTLMSRYYSIGCGYGEEVPLLWYEFYVGREVRNILVKQFYPHEEPFSTLLPLEAARASARWKGDWEGRK